MGDENGLVLSFDMRSKRKEAHARSNEKKKDNFSKWSFPHSYRKRIFRVSNFFIISL